MGIERALVVVGITLTRVLASLGVHLASPEHCLLALGRSSLRTSLSSAVRLMVFVSCCSALVIYPPYHESTEPPRRAASDRGMEIRFWKEVTGC
jgi:hypothetical protein